MNEHHDAHITLTRIVSHHEWKHAMARKDYASATEWSLLWFRCLIGPVMFNKAADHVINEDLNNANQDS